MSVIDISTIDELKAATSGSTKAVLLFGASWHEACPTLKTVMNVLAAEKTNIVFGYVDAESSSLSEEGRNGFAISSVPTILLLNGSVVKDDDNTTTLVNQSAVLERLEGGVLEPAQLTLAVQRLVQAPEGSTKSSAVDTTDAPPGAPDVAAASGSGSGSTAPATTTESSLNERLKSLIRADTVMLFMKGTPTEPKCGFSRQAVELLKSHDVIFGSFDILQDNAVRQGLKTYSDWPTYPQIYVRGELIGGLDIMKETVAEGPLKEQWEIRDEEMIPNAADTNSTTQSLDDRLRQLINRSPTMLFMKGLPSAPQCGFSRKIVEILDETGVAYDAFNILEDPEVRQGLKDYSDWPTYPQLYHNGELLGGLDIVSELKDAGELQETLTS